MGNTQRTPKYRLRAHITPSEAEVQLCACVYVHLCVCVWTKETFSVTTPILWLLFLFLCEYQWMTWDTNKTFFLLAEPQLHINRLKIKMLKSPYISINTKLMSKSPCMCTDKIRCRLNSHMEALTVALLLLFLFLVASVRSAATASFTMSARAMLSGLKQTIYTLL